MKTFKNISVKNQTVVNVFYSTLSSNLERQDFIDNYDDGPLAAEDIPDAYKDFPDAVEKFANKRNTADCFLNLTTVDETTDGMWDNSFLYNVAKSRWHKFIKENPDKEDEVIDLANRTDLSEPVYRVIYNEYGEDAASYVEMVHYEVRFKFQNFVAARLAETQTYITRDTNIKEWYAKAFPYVDPKGVEYIDPEYTFGYVFDHDHEDDPEYGKLRDTVLDDMFIRERIRYKMYVSRESLKK